MIRPVLTRVLSLFFLWACLLSPIMSVAALPDAQNFSRVIELGNVEQARAWLDEGLPPDFEGQVIGSGLMIGAWTGSIRMMELFVERGADVNKTNVLGEQAVLHAAWKGHAAAVDWLLAHGAKINRQGKQWAALHYAAFAGHGEVVRMLLAHGAEVNALSTNGSTPLMMAAREGREAIAVELLQAGADPTLSNEWGDDAETWALRQRNTSIARLVANSDPALRKPVPTGPVKRSLPVNEMADKLLARARALEAQGKRIEAMKTYQAAMRAIHRAERDEALALTQAKPVPQVSGIRITAKRDNPQSQQAQVSYARPANDAGDATPEGSKVSAGGTATNAGSGRGQSASMPGTANQSLPQDPVERLMTQARELDAQGKRAEAMRLYRQAAAMLRQP